ncbi:MAG: hypothetical protein JSU06_00110 [Actinobacteria bacterium]|nr:hypothetical protein [Actinomycetota bacterium]
MDEQDHRPQLERARLAIEDAGWLLRRRVAWPVEDWFGRLGARGAIGVFGGGGIALAGVVAALAVGGSGGSANAGTTEAFVPPSSPPPATAIAAAPKPRKQARKPSGPTLHGAPPSFSPAKDVKAGVGEGTALGGGHGAGEAPARRGAAAGAGGAAKGTAGANETAASTARIGATPKATASAESQADSLATASSASTSGTGAGRGGAKGGSGAAGTANGESTELTGPPAPKAAKQVARRFADAFVLYEVGGIDAKVRKAFGQTSTKQLSRSLLRRPPRQPASVTVPQAKVVNVVAGPSRGSVYTVSVSLLRVGVTSELRLEMEQGVGKKWQVTNVLG